jgi:hypothetical protein
MNSRLRPTARPASAAGRVQAVNNSKLSAADGSVSRIAWLEPFAEASLSTLPREGRVPAAVSSHGSTLKVVRSGVVEGSGSGSGSGSGLATRPKSAASRGSGVGPGYPATRHPAALNLQANNCRPSSASSKFTANGPAGQPLSRVALLSSPLFSASPSSYIVVIRKRKRWI